MTNARRGGLRTKNTDTRDKITCKCVNCKCHNRIPSILCNTLKICKVCYEGRCNPFSLKPKVKYRLTVVHTIIKLKPEQIRRIEEKRIEEAMQTL